MNFLIDDTFSGILKKKLQKQLTEELISMRFKTRTWPFSSEMNKVSHDRASLYCCPDCGKSYMWKQGLNTHKRLHCGKEPRFQCPHCPKRCYQRGNLDSHIRNVHSPSVLSKVCIERYCVMVGIFIIFSKH